MPDLNSETSRNAKVTVESLVAGSGKDWWSFDPATREAFQLRIAAERFSQLKDRLAQLGKLAKLQGVERISTFDDLAPLLFQHTVYKSYPIALLEKGRFDLLTNWLGGLTTHDLSQVEVKGCTTIAGWFDALEAQSLLRPNHTSGTSGKLSVIPRGVDELELFYDLFPRSGDPVDGAINPLVALRDEAESVPVIFPSYRYGRAAPQRALQAMQRFFGNKCELYALYDDHLSPDVAVLAGRVQAAEQRGTLNQLEISPELLRQFKQSRSAGAGEAEAKFMDRVLENCVARRVYLLAPVPMLYRWMDAAKARGVDQLFAPGSWVSSGGGTKGAAIPENWKAEAERFVGSPVREGYGMSELTTGSSQCEHNRYHFLPFTVTFLLDAQTGAPLPREGKQTGRLAVFDLLPSTYWGGFVTGDRVTMGYDDCPCGRKGAYVEHGIQRFSEVEGGDDKISCAGSSDAHEAALEYLLARAAQI